MTQIINWQLKQNQLYKVLSKTKIFWDDFLNIYKKN